MLPGRGSKRARRPEHAGRRAGQPAAAQDASLGTHEYIVSCAVCHGVYGKGDGGMAVAGQTAAGIATSALAPHDANL